MYYAKKYWVGGGVVYNFVPFVASESFTDPKKFADFGLTVNLYEKFRVYKMTWAGADVAVEFSDAIASIEFTSAQLPTGGSIEVFQTIGGVESSVLLTTVQTYNLTAGSTKRYFIRRYNANYFSFTLPIGSVWAYCCCITNIVGYSTAANLSLKYIFFYENTLTTIGALRNTSISGTLYIPTGVTTLGVNTFRETPITKVVTSNNLTTINGTSASGAFQLCKSLLRAELGSGIMSIGTDTFNGCTSLVPIICMAFNPPTLATKAFRGIPAAAKFYVPDNRVAAYKAATGWMFFASRIFSINDL